MSEIELHRPKQLRKQWGWERAGQISDQMFYAAVREFRLAHLDKMHDKLTDMHVRRAERIARELAATDNPLTKELLLRQCEIWMRDSARLLEG